MDNKIMGKEPIEVQELIRDKGSISIPMLQQDYGLRYSQAREALAQLQRRGWVAPNCRGVEFRVRKRKLFMRRLEHWELEHLMKNYGGDCQSALERAAQGGAAIGELERAVRGEEDTVNAIRELTDMKLLHREGELFFSRVSDQTVAILGQMRQILVCMLDQTENMDEEDQEADGSDKILRNALEEIEKLFKPLFE